MDCQDTPNKLHQFRLVTNRVTEVPYHNVHDVEQPDDDRLFLVDFLDHYLEMV